MQGLNIFFYFLDLESSPELSHYIWSQILITLSTIISSLNNPNSTENKTQAQTSTAEGESSVLK